MGFLVFVCVHDTATTRGEYLALSEGSSGGMRL